MSGVKRRTAYRKAVTDAVSDTFPELGPTECVVRVVRSQGSNLFEVSDTGELSSQPVRAGGGAWQQGCGQRRPPTAFRCFETALLPFRRAG